jgi:hypothetical protein
MLAMQGAIVSKRAVAGRTPALLARGLGGAMYEWLGTNRYIRADLTANR